jgi:MFS family permease
VGTFIALFISSALMASFLAVLTLLDEGIPEARRAGAAALFGFFLAYLLVGLPAHTVLQRIGRRGLRAYAFTGAAVGLLLAPLADLLDTDSPPDASLLADLRSVALLSLWSGAAASVFWLVRSRIPTRERTGVAKKPAA